MKQKKSKIGVSRYKYVDKFMGISCVSLIFVALMIMADGLKITAFNLSDSVIIALLGTALSTVIAPTYLLAKCSSEHDKDLDSR